MPGEEKKELSNMAGPRRPHARKVAVITVAGVLVVMVLVVSLLWTGALQPPGAAARYNGMKYIFEDEVAR